MGWIDTPAGPRRMTFEPDDGYQPDEFSRNWEDIERERDERCSRKWPGLFEAMEEKHEGS
jgi:hypothetical protein